MRSFDQRRRSSIWRAPIVAAGAMAMVSVTLVIAWWFGLLDLSRFRAAPLRSTAGLVAVPTPARTIPAFTKVNRDHMWDPAKREFTFIYLPPQAVTREMLVNQVDVLGRVLDHDKPAGYVFTESDFLPKGTREGVVAGIPAGKRAIRVPADKVEGLYGLRVGDRFDLVATLAIDGARGGSPAQAFNFGGLYGQQLALQARLSNWQKQATVRVMAQNGVVVEPMTTRQVPVFSASLTQGGIVRMRPVQEIVIAIDPGEVAPLTEAMAVDAKISCVPRSGRPDDPVNSKTPGLRPTSPFSGPGTGGLGTRSGDPFAVVETIMGPKRELTAVPNR
jgi:hypothetical protein